VITPCTLLESESCHVASHRCLVLVVDRRSSQLPYLQEGLLHHVLGFAAIPDDQAEGAVQTGVLRVDEVVEVDRGGSGGLLGSPRFYERRVGREAKWFVHPET